ADGALQYIPFAALPSPKAEGGRRKDESRKAPGLHPSSLIPHPLILEHEVVSLPSASVVAVLRHEMAGRRAAPKTLAVFADPVFENDDARLKQKPAGNGKAVNGDVARSLAESGIE